MFASELAAGAWVVDAKRLRTTLDELQTALSAHVPLVVDASGIVASEGARLFNVIQHLVNEIASVDLVEMRGMPTFVRETSGSVRFAELAVLVRDLQSAWKRRLPPPCHRSSIGCAGR